MKPIRQQLCKECLEKYRLFENARRQKFRIKINLVAEQNKINVPIKYGHTTKENRTKPKS